MTFQQINCRVCPCCGRDVARITRASDGFRVICNPDHGGCGTESGLAESEARAVALWNADPGPWDQLSAGERIAGECVA